MNQENESAAESEATGPTAGGADRSDSATDPRPRDDRVVFSTDYPHGDSKYPDSIPAFDELPIPDESKVKILGPNWQSLYKIPLAKRR